MRNIKLLGGKIAKFVTVTALVFAFDGLVLVALQHAGYRVTIHVYKQVDADRPNRQDERNGFTLRLY